MKNLSSPFSRLRRLAAVATAGILLFGVGRAATLSFDAASSAGTSVLSWNVEAELAGTGESIFCDGVTLLCEGATISVEP